MWCMTSTGGFFSAVEHRDDSSLLMVRCRAEADAKYIAKKTGAKVVKSNGHADYEFRVTITKAQYAAFMVNEVLAIDYANFKDSVKKRQGAKRAGIYMSVWSALCKLQPNAPYSAARSWVSSYTPSRTPSAGSQALYPVGPRGGVQQHWWDNESIVGRHITDEEAGGQAALDEESVTDDPEFWNCRVCNKDFTECTCFRDSGRQQAETDSARKKTRKRNKRRGGHAKNR